LIKNFNQIVIEKQNSKTVRRLKRSSYVYTDPFNFLQSDRDFYFSIKP